MRRFWSPEMSFDDNHRHAHMPPTARNICTFAILFCLFIAVEGQYVLCSMEEFVFKVEQSLAKTSKDDNEWIKN